MDLAEEGAKIGVVSGTSSFGSTCFLQKTQLAGRRSESDGFEASSVGGLVKIRVDKKMVIGSLVRLEERDEGVTIAHVEYLGEGICNANGQPSFAA